MADLSNIINSASKKYNIDPNLLSSVIQQESGGNPAAVNKGGGGKGAYGAMQVRQAALADYNKENGTSHKITDLTNPNLGVEVGSWYLGKQLDRFNDPYKALIAYNEGPNSQAVSKDTHPYAQAVIGRVNQQPNKPQGTQLLAGIPSSNAQQNNLSPDDVLDAFMGGKKSPITSNNVALNKNTTQGQLSPDQVFEAFTNSPSKGSVSQNNPQTDTQEQPGKLETFAAGLGHGMGSMALGTEQLLGKGLGWVGDKTGIEGISKAGKALASDAGQGLNKIEQDFAPYRQANPMTAVGGDIAGQVIPSLLGGGGVITKGGQLGQKAAGLAGLGNTGQAVGRLAGAAGGSAALGGGLAALSPVSPQEADFSSAKLGQIGMGAGLGAAIPVAGNSIGKGVGYAGNLAALPFRVMTESGRNKIAQEIIQNAGKGGPQLVNAEQMIPGVTPTLAEATGNPGIASLQRSIRDINPSPFVEREQQAAQGRLTALEGITGTPEEMIAAKSSIANDAADQYLSTSVGIPTKNTDFNSLKKLPAFQKAYKDAEIMAKNAGTTLETQTQNRALANRGGEMRKPETYVSGQGLHMIKHSLDDQINAAAKAGEKGKAAILINIKNRLLGMMDDNIDGYAKARSNFSEASRPIDAMEYLQTKNFTNTNGDVTPAKVDSVIKRIIRDQKKPGINKAKSINETQLQGLMSLLDELRRSTSTGLGKSLGSNTVQNLAYQNMVQNAIPGRLGALASGASPSTMGGGLGALLGYAAAGPLGAPAGLVAGKYVGKAAGNVINSQNDAIQNALAQLLLNPTSSSLQSAARSGLPTSANSALQRLAYPSAVVGGNRLVNGRE